MSFSNHAQRPKPPVRVFFLAPAAAYSFRSSVFATCSCPSNLFCCQRSCPALPARTSLHSALAKPQEPPTEMPQCWLPISGFRSAPATGRQTHLQPLHYDARFRKKDSDFRPSPHTSLRGFTGSPD